MVGDNRKSTVIAVTVCNELVISLPFEVAPSETGTRFATSHTFAFFKVTLAQQDGGEEKIPIQIIIELHRHSACLLFI